MLEINISKAKKSYGFKKVLDEFDLDITSGERVALIGPNGCGKTTLLKLIAGMEKTSSGIVATRKDASIGLLTQTPPNVDDNCTVRQVLTRDLGKIYLLEQKIAELENKMSNCSLDELDELLKTYGKLRDQFEFLGGYEIDTKVNKICTGFKIMPEMLERKFNTLSGGEKTIINLASLILSEPSILLLDEPTNHLDIETLEWLEEYLKNYSGTVVISSHDRYFLDKVATKTVLIERGKSEVFHGNYSYYLKENERRIMSEFEDYKNQQKQIEAMKKKIKQLQEWGKLAYPGGVGFFKRAASIQKRLDKLELLDKPETKKELPLDFQINERSGKEVLKVTDLGIILGDRVIFDGADFQVRFGEKVCMMGKNGSGKSTFVKAMLGDVEILDGEIKLGSNVSIGYIPQEIKFDNETATVLDTAREYFNGSETHLRASLAKFLFYGENVFKRVGSLSGGEKVRLKLFELIQKNANFLVLDEPTNHIDIDTKEVLEEALADYPGTLMFISHDRYFINKLARRILYIEDTKVNEYLGNYDDYKHQKEKRLELTKNNTRNGRNR